MHTARSWHVPLVWFYMQSYCFVAGCGAGRKWPTPKSTLAWTLLSGAVTFPLVSLSVTLPGLGTQALPPPGSSMGQRVPRGKRLSGPHLPTLAGMWLMLLRMVVTPERASCCTLVLRAATPNSWPLIAPIMLPRPPWGSPGRKEENNSDTIHL